MTFKYNNKYCCIFCDWLQFSVRLVDPSPELFCPDGYRIEVLQGNNIYRNRFIVYDADGRKVLTALWSPYSSVLDPLVMTIQIANWVLYTMSDDFVWNLLLQIVDCEFNSCGRIDICMDFEQSEEFIELLKHLNSGHYYVQAKKEGSVWWHENGAVKEGFRQKEMHCQSWGSKTSEIKWKIYFKSREIGIVNGDMTKCEKPWIANEWSLSSMDVTKVWRIEVSLTGASCLRQGENKIATSDVWNSEWLYSVMCDMLYTRFVIRINQGRRSEHKNNDARVHFFDIPKECLHLSWNRPRDTPPPSDAIVSLRRLMRCFDDAPTRTNARVFEIVARSVCELVEVQHLEDYFEKRFGASPLTYFETMFQDVGTGLYQGVDSPSKFFD